MGIKANFDMKEIKMKLEQAQMELEREVIRLLNYLGEKCVDRAKEVGSYEDRTSNLRNSMGFVVLKDGIPVTESFKGKTEEGRVNGQKIASEVSEKHKKGLVLIVVAGMNYAAYVESKDRDVLASTELWAEGEAERIFNKLMKMKRS